ncbi:MAG: hypothetical protein ACE5J2_07995 [Nitrososphaerales archaeon]
MRLNIRVKYAQSKKIITEDEIRRIVEQRIKLDKPWDSMSREEKILISDKAGVERSKILKVFHTSPNKILELRKMQETQKPELATSTSNEQIAAEQALEPPPEEKVQLEPRERMVVYCEFLVGKKPPEVISKHGFPTRLVEDEFQKFLKYSECDIYALQERIMEHFGIDTSHEDYRIRKLAENYNKNGYLPNDQFFEVIRHVGHVQYEAGLNALDDVHDAPPPRGWTKIRCCVCGQPFYGAVVDPTSSLGRAILRFCKENRGAHSSCY